MHEPKSFIHVFWEITVIIIIINNTPITCLGLLSVSRGFALEWLPSDRAKPTQQFFKIENSLATFTSTAKNTGICLANFTMAFQCSTPSSWRVREGWIILKVLQSNHPHVNKLSWNLESLQSTQFSGSLLCSYMTYTLSAWSTRKISLVLGHVTWPSFSLAIPRNAWK